MKMKRMLWLTVVVLALALILAACGKKEKKPDATESTPPSTPDNVATLTLAETNVYEINDSDDVLKLSLTVPNDTELLYLYQYIQAKDGVEWILSSDIEATGSSTITSKTVQLEEGENTYYILCTGENNLFEIYTLSIYRRHMYTVSFENLTETQKVEEGGMAALPAGKPQKTGYTFVSWSFNFTDPIAEDLSVKANYVSRKIVEMGLSIFKDCIPDLRARNYPAETRDKLMLMSALGGAAIAQTMTSLPHGMGYFLTYEKGLAHGMANGVLTQAYVEQFPAGDEHVAKLLECLGFADTKELGAFLDDVLDHEATYTEDDLNYYTDRFMEQPGKIATFPYPLTRDDIYNMYKKSLMK